MDKTKIKIVMYLYDLSKNSVLFAGDGRLLAKETDLDENVCLDNLQELIDKGFIRNGNISVGGKTVTCYILTHDCLFNGLCDTRLKLLQDRFDNVCKRSDQEKIAFIENSVYM